MIISILVILTVFLWLWAVFPSVRRHPDRSLLQGRYIAHRGLHDCDIPAPENSMPAFRHAVELGYPIETDIHVTKDGEIIVFHDDDLFRMCGIHGKPENMTLAELREFRLSGTENGIPTLKELLEEVNGRVPLLIEYKCTDRKTCRRLCEAADAVLSEYKGKYLIQSFYPFVLSWFRKRHPDICRGQLSSAFRDQALSHRLLGLLLTDFLARPDFVSYECRYGKTLPLWIVSFLGAMPIGWTFRSEEDLLSYQKQFRAWIFETFLPDDSSGKDKKENTL